MRIAYALTAMLFGVIMLAGTAGASSVSCSSSNIAFKVTNVFWGNSTRNFNSTHTISAGPGQKDAPLTITLESYGFGQIPSSCYPTNVKAELVLYGGVTGLNGTLYPIVYLPQISVPSIFNLVFYLNIGSNVAAGPDNEFTGSLYLYYNFTNYTSTPNIAPLTAIIPMHGSPNLTYTPESYGLLPGLNNVTIEVSNRGTGGITNLQTRVTAPSQVAVIQQPGMVYSLEANSTKKINLLLYSESGSAGSPVTLNLDSSYISPYGYNTSTTGELGMYTSSQPQGVSIYSENQTLIAGKAVNETVVVENQGSSPIYNVSVGIVPASPLQLLGRNSYVNIAKIAANSNASFNVTLYQPSSTTTYGSMAATVSYTLNSQQQTISRTVTFLTPGYVDLNRVSSTVLPAAPAKGEIFTITSTLDNLGSQTAQSASVTAYPPNGITVIGQNTTFIGSVPVASPTAFTVTMLVSQSANPGAYTIPVQISYLNNLNQRLSTNFTYNVEIGTQSFNSSLQGGGTGVTVRRTASARSQFPVDLVVIIAIAAVAVAAYIYFRKRRRARVHK